MYALLSLLGLLFGAIALWGALGMLAVNRNKDEFAAESDVKSAGTHAFW